MKRKLTLFFLLFSLTTVAQEGFYVGLGIGAGLPLGENRTTGVMITPISLLLQDKGIENSLTILAGFQIATKNKYPALYQRPTGTYKLPPGEFTPVPEYEYFTSNKNALSGGYVLLEYERYLLGADDYQLGALLSLGIGNVTFSPKDDFLKDRKDIDKNQKNQVILAIGLQNTFYFNRGMAQLSLQYGLQNPTIENRTPSLRGNYLILRLSFSSLWFNSLLMEDIEELF